MSAREPDARLGGTWRRRQNASASPARAAWELVGINQRTRLVRASDVARFRPLLGRDYWPPTCTSSISSVFPTSRVLKPLVSRNEQKSVSMFQSTQPVVLDGEIDSPVFCSFRLTTLFTPHTAKCPLQGGKREATLFKPADNQRQGLDGL